MERRSGSSCRLVMLTINCAVLPGSITMSAVESETSIFCISEAITYLKTFYTTRCDGYIGKRDSQRSEANQAYAFAYFA